MARKVPLASDSLPDYAPPPPPLHQRLLERLARGLLVRGGAVLHKLKFM